MSADQSRGKRLRLRLLMWLLMHTETGRAAVYTVGFKWYDMGRFVERHGRG